MPVRRRTRGRGRRRRRRRPGPSRRPQARPMPVRPGNRPARVGARGVLAVIIAGAVVVIALWWHSTPGVHGLGGWLTGAGEILGLLCGYGVVVLVALMSRLPPLERGLGTDKLARWHAMGGRYVVSLVVAHGLLIIWGYAVTAHASVVSETRDAAHPVPGRADGDRGRVPAARHRHRLDARRPAAGPLRDVVLPAPVHLPGDRPGVQPPARRRRGVRQQPGRAVLVVRDVPDGARPGAVVPGRGPAAARSAGTASRSSG